MKAIYLDLLLRMIAPANRAALPCRRLSFDHVARSSAAACASAPEGARR